VVNGAAFLTTKLTSRIRVLNVLPVGTADAQMLDAVSDRIEVVNRPLSPEELDAFRDDQVEAMLGSRSPLLWGGLPRLRWLQLASAGVDRVADDPAFTHGVTVTNARGVYSIPIAEYTIWALLDHNQKASARRRLQMERSWPANPDAAAGALLRGQTLLIVGYGSIGRETARLASAFGMRVVAVKADPSRKVDDGFCPQGTGDPAGVLPEQIAGMDALAFLARTADALVDTLPLTKATRGVISAQVIDALPPHAALINVGRGATVDTGAMVRALDANQLGAAYLDVFAVEPLPGDDAMWSHPKITITPHVSGGGAQDPTLLFELFAANLKRYLAGDQLLNVVDRARGY
jgi:phosphoglycerate dehydrogenase-like enzyme